MKLTIILSVVAGLSIAGCNSTKIERQKTPLGVEYEVNKAGEGKQVAVGDYVTLHLEQRTNSDSLFFTTYERDPITFQVTDPKEYQDPSGWVTYLHVGDSATFYLISDSIYNAGIAPPPFIKAGDTVRFVINIINAQPEADYMSDQLQKQNQRVESEVKDIEAVLQQKGISDFKKSPEGIIYTVQKQGTGPQPQPGQKVKVHYTLSTLDGQKLESSRDGGSPFSFTLGQGEVIPGWDKGIPLLNVGSTATLYLPSSLAYGESGSQRIPPNTPLVFDIEVLDIVDAAKEKAEAAKKLDDYLKNNNIKAQKSPEGIYYTVQTQGTGPKPQPGQTVQVNYTGKLLNGQVFDTSIETVAKANNVYNPQRTYGPFEFPLGQGRVIQGWDKGIPLFNVGGKGTLYIPADLAYGERGAGAMIPANSPLIFEIEVLGIK